MIYHIRRIVLASTVLALVLASFAFLCIPAVSAEDEVCWVLEVQFYNDLGYTATTSVDIITISPFHVYATTALTLAPGETGTARATALIPASTTGVVLSGTMVFAYLGGGLHQADISACSSGVAEIADGRVNGRDLAAPLAAYCENGGIAIWDIDAEGQGTHAFDVSAADISAALEQAVGSQQNVMIAEGMGNSLYALMSNELSLIGTEPGTGKPYQHILLPGVCGS